MDSEWLLTNVRGAAPDGNTQDDSHLDLPLWKLTLASAAAPAYYRPEIIEYGRKPSRRYILDDGGMTGALNPAFRAFMFATRNPSGPLWSTGEDRISIVSLGSGDAPFKRSGCANKINILNSILNMPNAMMQSSIREQENLCQYFGRSASDDRSAATCERHFRYHRLNPLLTTNNLTEMGFPNLTAGMIMPMDAKENLDILSDIGKVYAERHVPSLIADIHLRGQCISNRKSI